MAEPKCPQCDRQTITDKALPNGGVVVYCANCGRILGCWARGVEDCLSWASKDSTSERKERRG